jgi:hypothetical protein
MNSWKVLWDDAAAERRRFKKFEGDSPKEAVAFGRKLRDRGLTVLGIISMRVAYAPPKDKPKPDQYGIMWCPYCVKWRLWEFLGVHVGEVVLDPELRCPVCTISINHYWVRYFNPVVASRFLHLEGAKKSARS